MHNPHSLTHPRGDPATLPLQGRRASDPPPQQQSKRQPTPKLPRDSQKQIISPLCTFQLQEPQKKAFTIIQAQTFRPGPPPTCLRRSPPLRGWRGGGFGWGEAVGEDLHEVLGLVLVFEALGADALGEHLEAEGAGDADGLGAGLEEVARADVVDAGRGLVHPHAAAACAAAEAALAVVGGHFDEVDAGDGAGDVAGRVVDAVVAAKVAGVVVGEGRLDGAQGADAALGDELADELGGVHDLELAAKLGVLVAEGVEAVGAGGDDSADVVALQGLDVLLGEDLEEVLVAHAAGGSPVHVSSSPRIANLTPATLRMEARARGTAWERCSRAPVQPTQRRTSTSGSWAMVLTSMPWAQSVRE